MCFGVADETSLRVEPQQRLQHRQRNQLCIRQLRGDTHRGPRRRPLRMCCRSSPSATSKAPSSSPPTEAPAPGETSSATPPSPPPCSTGSFTAAPSSTSPATATASEPTKPATNNTQPLQLNSLGVGNFADRRRNIRKDHRCVLLAEWVSLLTEDHADGPLVVDPPGYLKSPPLGGTLPCVLCYGFATQSLRGNPAQGPHVGIAIA